MRTLHLAGMVAIALALCLIKPLPGYAQNDRTITIGDRVTGRIETPVTVGNYRFQGQAGIQIRIKISGDPGLEPAARLEVDNREVWFGGAPGTNVVDSGLITLDSSNQYLLQIRSANGRTGNYLLETSRGGVGSSIINGGELRPGAPLWGRLPGPNTGVRYTLFAEAGQKAQFAVRTGENLTARLTIQAPDGLVLWSERATAPNQGLSLPLLTLTITGPHQVYITAGGTSGGTYELTVNLVQ